MQDATLKSSPEPPKGRATISKIKRQSAASAAAGPTHGCPEAGPTTPCPAAPTLDASTAGCSSGISVQGSEPALLMEMDLNKSPNGLVWLYRSCCDGKEAKQSAGLCECLNQYNPFDYFLSLCEWKRCHMPAFIPFSTYSFLGPG